MEVQLVFRCSNAALPLANKHAVAGLLYHMVSSKADYADMLHQRGYPHGGKPLKLFTFSDLTGSYQIQGKRIVYRDRIEIRVRSHDPMFVRCLLLSAEKNRNYQLCGNALFLESYKVEDPMIEKDRLMIRTLSPITVHTTTADGKTLYFAPTDQAFYQAIADNAAAKLRALSMVEQRPITLELGGECSKLVTTYKGIYINGWRGTFRLSGPKDVLKLLYNTGLGDRNSQGFGMFEIIG